jgi:C-terminal processing protease CtpA/Prc
MSCHGQDTLRQKVIVLTNRLVYSAANYFSAICKVYGITLIGDQTGGGGGAPAGSELPNGFHVNYSSSICLLPDGYNIENGIPPDIKIDISDEDRQNHVDTILETALTQF